MTGPTAEADAFINPLDPDFIWDPYPVYARLRAECPVYWHAGMQVWLVAKYDDCVQVLRDPNTFGSDYRKAGIATDPALLNIQTLDPPEQSPLRRLFADALHSMNVRELEAAAEADAGNILASRENSGTVDFVSEIAAPYSMLSAMRILGINLRLENYAREAKQITDSSMPALLPELEAPGIEARKRVSDLLRRSFRDGAAGGVIGYLRSRPEAGELPEDLIVNSLRVTLLAITSSTGRFFTLGLKTLLETHDGLGKLVAAPSLDAAIHELIRFDGPFQAQEKVCLTPASIGGQKIRPGERVVVLFGSANRDEAVFPNAGQLDLTRRATRHLGFGRGNHACLGTHLGLVLSRAVLGHLAGKYPGTMLQAAPVMDVNPTIRGVKSMMVEIG